MIKAKLIFKTPTDGNYFFGYYDKLQLSRDNSKLLALKVGFMDRVPNKNDTAIIGYFCIPGNNKFTEISSTRVFNWQQGCMLQWLGKDFNNNIIYNDRINNKFVSIILNIESGEKKIIESPVYSTHPNGTGAITIDFERHHWCRRGYSYDGVFNTIKKKRIVNGDAIWRLDFRQKTSQKIILLEDIINNNPLSNMDGATHYLEHLMFNPSGERFCFLHRWKIQDGGIYARLYTANADGSDIFLLNDSGRMSHYAWQDDNHLLAYGGIENKINKLRKYKSITKYLIKPLLPLYHKLVNDNSKISKAITGDSYLLFLDKTSCVQRVATDISNEDGHPSFSREGNKRIFVTDTYPDPVEGSIAKLIIFDLDSQEAHLLKELRSVAKYDNTPTRCDLHPRWSYSGDYVSVDTMHDGFRSCYLYEVNFD